jgi:hypothetical protein
MNHPHILGLTGPAGSGKDTVADLLVAHAGFTKLAFADTLKAEVADAFAVDLEYLTRRETKEHPMSCLAMSRCLSDSFVGRMMTLHSQGSAALDLDAPHSPRQIMQWWGTDYRRAAQPEYWVSKTRNRISYLLRERLASRIVVTDCRFADEVEMVRRSFGGQLWQIHRDGVAVAPGSHVSETAGDEFRADVTLNNSHSVGHLQERVLEALWTQTAGLVPGSLRVSIAPTDRLAA